MSSKSITTGLVSFFKFLPCYGIGSGRVVTAALLIIKAAMVNDRILVQKLFAENVQEVDTKIRTTDRR